MSHFPQEIITVVGRCAAPLPARPAVGAPAGGLPGWLPADRAIPESTGGACLFGYPPPLPLPSFLPPIPPAPFPGGEGGAQGYSMQGAPPLASPALDRLRHLQTLPKRHPVGWLAFFVVCCPCLWLALSPPSPRPALAERSSRREGGDQGYFMQGAPPLASPGNKPTVRRENGKRRFPMNSAGSQGEGGSGEMELSVARDGGV